MRTRAHRLPPPKDWPDNAHALWPMGAAARCRLRSICRVDLIPLRRSGADLLWLWQHDRHRPTAHARTHHPGIELSPRCDLAGFHPDTRCQPKAVCHSRRKSGITEEFDDIRLKSGGASTKDDERILLIDSEMSVPDRQSRKIFALIVRCQ